MRHYLPSQTHSGLQLASRELLLIYRTRLLLAQPRRLRLALAHPETLLLEAALRIARRQRPNRQRLLLTARAAGVHLMSARLPVQDHALPPPGFA